MAKKSLLKLTDWVSVGTTCLLLSVLYFFAYGFYGFSDTDQGFIQGLSWRVLQGEIPYLDFTYVRPPLSIYLHSLGLLLPMPILLSRLFFYLNCGLSVWLCTRSLQQYFDFQPIGISPTIFAAISYVCVVHNFPPMPWHTTDGLLFASLGIYGIATGKGIAPTVWGLLALVLAALCKQSFYPLLVVGPLLVLILKESSDAKWSIGLYMGILFVLGLILFFGMQDAFMAFLNQSRGVSSFSDLLEVGLFKYGKPLLLILVPVLLVWRLEQDLILPNFWKFVPAIIFWLFFGSLLSYHVYRALISREFLAPSFGFSQAFFLLAVGVTLRGTWINTRSYSLLLAMLIVAWCAGLSWGYARTSLFFTPVLFAFFLMLYDDLEFRVPRYFYGVVFILLAWTYGVMYQFPYRSAPREETTFHAGDIFSKMYGIQVGEEMYRKCEELSKMSSKYTPRVTVLPSFPLANFLTNTTNPLRIDWAHNAEIGGIQQLPTLIQQLDSSDSYVFMEKDKLREFTDSTRYGSLLSGHVVQNWTPIEEGEYFTVYSLSVPNP
ncbi:MAG: hypothetical protein AAF694_30530 [Bacteroidota bacterium]